MGGLDRHGGPLTLGLPAAGRLLVLRRAALLRLTAARSSTRRHRRHGDLGRDCAQRLHPRAASRHCSVGVVERPGNV